VEYWKHLAAAARRGATFDSVDDVLEHLDCPAGTQKKRWQAVVALFGTRPLAAVLSADDFRADKKQRLLVAAIKRYTAYTFCECRSGLATAMIGCAGWLIHPRLVQCGRCFFAGTWLLRPRRLVPLVLVPVLVVLLLLLLVVVLLELVLLLELELLLELKLLLELELKLLLELELLLVPVSAETVVCDVVTLVHCHCVNVLPMTSTPDA
jgi:hypothetical protein